MSNRHYRYGYLENYVRRSRRQRKVKGYRRLRRHLQTCRLCQSTIDDIVNLDPYLGVVQKHTKKLMENRWMVIWRGGLR